MTCNSQRVIASTRGQFLGEQETVRCERVHGHPGDRHHGITEDLETIHWTGCPSALIQPVPEKKV